MRQLGIYLHIPFCAKKCNYCDFLSAPAGKDVQQAYVDRLVQEIQQKPAGKKECCVTSIFFGGGTPSLLAPNQIGAILAAVQQQFCISPDVEISLEINPGTLGNCQGEDPCYKLEAYCQMGINRLSIGLQSFCDKELELLGRIHRVQDFLKLYDAARQVGFNNINKDLMSGLPGQTRRGFAHTLQQAVDLQPEHISVYSLIIEPGTPFYQLYSQDVERRDRGETPLYLPTEEIERAMIADTVDMLTAAGYIQYEISNFAKPGHICRHNNNCWLRTEYLGYGIGAASLYNETRFSNHTDLKAYLNGQFAPATIQPLDIKDQMEETMFLGLRRIQGVSKQAFFNKFGISVNQVYKDVISRFVQQGLLYQNNDFVALTKKGLDISNYVMADFLLDT